MATWNAPLPAEAVEGADTHVEDHNKINAALAEVRSNVDTVEGEAQAAPAWGDVTGKPSTFTPSGHTHELSDVTGLQSALDSKQAAGSYAAAADLAALAARVDALEAAAES